MFLNKFLSRNIMIEINSQRNFKFRNSWCCVLNPKWNYHVNDKFFQSSKFEPGVICNVFPLIYVQSVSRTLCSTFAILSMFPTFNSHCCHSRVGFHLLKPSLYNNPVVLYSVHQFRFDWCFITIRTRGKYTVNNTVF